MKRDQVIFWVITILFGGYMLFSAIPEVMQLPADKEFIKQLKFPEYVSPLLGVMKILGVIAILIPGYPRIKEWAYAGLFFDLLGATYSIVMAFGLSGSIVFMILPIIFLFISYAYYHKIRKAKLKPAV